MPDRLAELVRQRALILEHLAWLEREIASVHTLDPAPVSASETPPLVSAPASAPHPAPAAISVEPPPVRTASAAANEATANVASTGTVAVTRPAGIAPPEADHILERYRVPVTAVTQDVRKGCLLYFAGAFVVLGIVVAILYLTISSR